MPIFNNENGLSLETIIAIVYLVIIIAVIITVWVIVHKIRKKIRQYSKSLFGTSSFIKGYAEQTASIADEPRSLNGMTEVCLPKIVRDFPEFNYNEVKSKSEMLIKAYLNSIEAENTNALNDEQVSPTLREKVQNIIDDLRSQGKHIFYDDIVIYNTEISDYTTGNGRCIIRFQSAVGFVNYIRDIKGNIIQGTDQHKRQTVYQSEYTYIQDLKKLYSAGQHESYSLSCPNCGAPIVNLGAKFCEYCGTGIKEINIKSWKFTNIEEHGIRSKNYF